MNTRYQKHRDAARCATLFCLLLMSALVCAALWPIPALAAGVNPVPQPVVAALLVENWESLAGVHLADVDVSTPSPVLRLIKGHACLATNQNDESFCLFRSASAPADLAVWDNLTEALLAEHPNNPAAGYLRADAFARLGDWISADKQFSKALESGSPRLQAMVLNGRGIALAGLKRLEEAVVSIYNATQVYTSLADAHANAGFLSLLQKEGAKEAFNDFKTAVYHSPNFSLAQYGKGFTASILSDFEEAEEAFDISLSKPDCIAEYISPLVHAALRHLSDRNAALIAQTDGDNPGMSVNNVIEEMNNNDLGFMGSHYKQGFKTALQVGGKSLSNFEAATAAYLKRNPGHTNYISRYRHQVGNDIAATSLLNKYEVGTGNTIGLNFKSPTQKAGVGAGLQGSINQSLTFDMRPAARSAFSALGRYKQSEIGLQRMTPLYQTKSQGFDSAPSGAGIDAGDWPFEAVFGLAYPTSTL